MLNYQRVPPFEVALHTSQGSQDGRLGPAFTEPLALSNLSGPSSVVVDLTPEDGPGRMTCKAMGKPMETPEKSRKAGGKMAENI